MKKILLIICLFPILVFSQKSYKIPADSTILNNIGSGKNELVIRNATSNITGGVLTNLGNGVTAFVLGGGSSASSTLFPNGIEFVSESRYFQVSDAGKRLFISGVNTIIAMPEDNPFVVGDYVGIINDGTDISFNIEYEGEYIFPLKTGDGATSECVVLMNTEIEGSSWLFPISTSFKYDNTDSKKKTALRYLYDQSQNAIPLSGTEVGKPVTGDIEFEFDSGKGIVYKDENVNYGFIIGDTPIMYYDGTASGQNKTQLRATETAFVISKESGENGFIGLAALEDLSANITDLAYAQKIYVDNAISSNRKVDTSYIFRNATLDSTCMITVINGITYRSCAKDSVGSGTAYTFSTGLTNTSSTITNNLSTGVSGGQSVIGGTASGENLTLSSTSNATKGKILFGTSAYDEVNNRLGIGTNAPSAKLEVRGISDFWGLQVGNGTVGALFQVNGGNAGFVGFNGSAYNNLDIRCSSSTQLFLSTNGNVGIADNNPSQRLSLNGALYFSGASTPSATTAIYAPTLYSLAFMTNSVERIRINNIGNVGIGTTTPVASAKLEVSSTTSGFLPPRMTATQASAISSPAQGLMLFVTDTNGTFTSVGWWGYNGATWEKLNN